MNRQQLIGIGLAGWVIVVLAGAFSNGQAIGQSTIDLDTLRQNALSQHNIYRSTHHAPALTASDDLDNSAQSWAEHLASTGVFKHSDTKTGENLYAAYTTATNLDTSNLGNDAVKSWYDEVEKYDYENPGFSLKTGHFTQVVWKESTQVGCGAAQGTTVRNGRKFNAFYVVCHYNPPGNVDDEYSANVQQP